MGRPVVVVAGRHRPHEILLLAVAVLTGLAYTLGAPPPNSLAALLPGWSVRVWAVGLALHGVAGLAACASKARWSLPAEQASMLVGAAALVWYAVALADASQTAGARALLSGGITLAWAGANLWRAGQIYHDLRGLP